MRPLPVEPAPLNEHERPEQVKLKSATGGGGGGLQVSETGLEVRSVPELSNFALIRCEIPSLRLDGVAIEKPCSPLSPRKEPTSGRDHSPGRW